MMLGERCSSVFWGYIEDVIFLMIDNWHLLRAGPFENPFTQVRFVSLVLALLVYDKNTLLCSVSVSGQSSNQ